MAVRNQLFRYTSYDAFPSLCAVANVALLVGTLLGFHVLPAWALAASFCAIVFCYCWNVQSISHNFIHNPFFTSIWLNRAYSVLETFALGVPHVFYHHYHMNHHWGDSDMKGPDGSTRDWSSIYRHSKDDGPEPFWRYCLLGFFRVEVGPVVRTVARHGRRQMIKLVVETLAVGAFWAAISW